MSARRRSTSQNYGYGALGRTPVSTRHYDRRAYNAALIERLNEPLISQIRQQTAAEADGPFPSKFKQIARSRRRPNLRVFKSETDFPALFANEDVDEIREKLIQTYYTHNPSFHLKSVPKFSHKQKLVLLSIALVDFTSFCAMSILAPFFPAEASAKGVSTSVSGFIFSVYALVVFIASPFMGILVSKVGPKFLLQIGVFLGGSCNILFGLLDRVESTTVFTTYCFLVRIFEALGAAAFATSSYTYVAKLFPDNIGAVLGILETFVGLGMSLGPAIGGFLFDWGGYGLPFFSLGVLMLITIPINCFLLPTSTYETSEVESRDSMWKLFKLHPIILVTLVVVVASNTWSFLDPTLEPHLREFALPAKQVSLFFLLSSVFYGLSSPCWGYLADKMDNTWILMVIGLILSSFGLILIGPSPILPLENSIWINVVALIILGLSISLTLLPTFESLLDFAIEGGYRDDVGTYGLIAGLWSSMYSLGEVIGPSLGAALVDHFGFPVCSTVMSSFCLVLGLVLLFYFLFLYEASPIIPTSLFGDKLNLDISDSGISENEGIVTGTTGMSSCSSSASSTSLQITREELPQDQPSKQNLTTIVQINENTPLLRPNIKPVIRRENHFLDRLHLHSDYCSEPVLVGLQEGRRRSIPKTLNYINSPIVITSPEGNCRNISIPENIGCGGSSVGSIGRYDYGGSYPSVMKTISITGFGAVEV